MSYFSNDVISKAKALLRECEQVRIHNFCRKIPFADANIVKYLASKGYDYDSGSFRAVWICDDFVLKFGFTEHGRLDCKREVKLYKKAVSEGVASFFAKIEFLGYYKKTIPVWIMENVNCCRTEVYMNTIEYKELSKLETPQERLNYLREHPVDYCDQVREFFKARFSEDEIEKLENFCDRNGINDLHDDNIGLIDNKVVICDYAGYKRY